MKRVLENDCFLSFLRTRPKSLFNPFVMRTSQRRRAEDRLALPFGSGRARCLTVPIGSWNRRSRLARPLRDAPPSLQLQVYFLSVARRAFTLHACFSDAGLGRCSGSAPGCLRPPSCSARNRRPPSCSARTMSLPSSAARMSPPRNSPGTLKLCSRSNSQALASATSVGKEILCLPNRATSVSRRSRNIFAVRVSPCCFSSLAEPRR